MMITDFAFGLLSHIFLGIPEQNFLTAVAMKKTIMIRPASKILYKKEYDENWQTIGNLNLCY